MVIELNFLMELKTSGEIAFRFTKLNIQLSKLLLLISIGDKSDEITPKYDPHGTNCIRPMPRPNHHMVGGCESTRYGCCPGSNIASNKHGSNC